MALGVDLDRWWLLGAREVGSPQFALQVGGNLTALTRPATTLASDSCASGWAGQSE